MSQLYGSQTAVTDANDEKAGLSFRQKIAVVILDLVMLGELFAAMYFAHQHPDNFTPVFFKVFFGLLVPTLLLGWVTIRKLRPTEA